MVTLDKLRNDNINIAAEIYCEAYSKEPWNERYEITDVSNYISRFILGNSNCGWILYENSIAIGVALGIIIPTVGKDYFRTEDLCVYSMKQGLGYGSEFIKLISKEIKQYNVDSILLNTVKEFPSYKFYIKNDFKEIKDSATLLLEI